MEVPKFAKITAVIVGILAILLISYWLWQQRGLPGVAGPPFEFQELTIQKKEAILEDLLEAPPPNTSEILKKLSIPSKQEPTVEQKIKILNSLQ